MRPTSQVGGHAPTFLEVAVVVAVLLPNGFEIYAEGGLGLVPTDHVLPVGGQGVDLALSSTDHEVQVEVLAPPPTDRVIQVAVQVEVQGAVLALPPTVHELQVVTQAEVQGVDSAPPPTDHVIQVGGQGEVHVLLSTVHVIQAALAPLPTAHDAPLSSDHEEGDPPHHAT